MATQERHSQELPRLNTPRVSPKRAAKDVLLIVEYEADTRGLTHASRKDIARFTGHTVGKVRSAMRLLRQSGDLLTIHGGRKPCYASAALAKTQRTNVDKQDKRRGMVMR